MRPPQMTTRRWMVAVAIVAFGIGAWILIARSHSYAIETAKHDFREAYHRWLVDSYESDGLGFSGRGSIEEGIDRLRRRISYHAALKRKYELASRRPWLPVEPDPPEPE